MRTVIMIIGASLLLIALGIYAFVRWMKKSDARYIQKILQREHATSSFVMKENGDVQVDLRSSEMMPLASTVKIVIAIEYAFQVYEGKIDNHEPIHLRDLETYYLPKLDGGAHEAWLHYAKEKKLVQKEMVTLREVARGMIAFSSNANTEFLMQRLGIEQIEERMKSIGIEAHSPLFYLGSATFIPYELHRQQESDRTMKEAKKKMLETMKQMSDEEWRLLSSVIHEKLTADPHYKQRANVLDWWDYDYDQLYSKKFTKSTAATYADIMEQINNRQFPQKAQEELEYVLGMLMERPENQKWLKRAGQKGGSTFFIVTDALFAEDQRGNTFEMAIFFNDLKWYQTHKIMSSLNEFELKCLSDPSFRKHVYEALNPGRDSKSERMER
ncbi:MAG TPA: serine hydrolase, partial [Bacillota bacterium]|nr:serine hydrolase [Bacillota bacterium]